MYPENPYGGVTTYFGLRSFNGAYPIGSEASVYCNEGLAQPRSIRCQPGGFWQSFFCHPTLAISPKKPPNNEWLKEMQIASKQGGTGSTLTLEQGVTKFDSSVLSITSRWRFPGGPAVTSSIIGDMTTNVQQTIEIGPDAGEFSIDISLNIN